MNFAIKLYWNNEERIADEPLVVQANSFREVLAWMAEDKSHWNPLTGPPGKLTKVEVRKTHVHVIEPAMTGGEK